MFKCTGWLRNFFNSGKHNLSFLVLEWIGIDCANMEKHWINFLFQCLYMQVSYASACTCFSDKSRFPSFLRIFPSDAHQVSAMAHLVLHLGWLYVGTIAVDDDYGRPAVAQFVEITEQNGLCIAFRESIPKVQSHHSIVELGKLLFTLWGLNEFFCTKTFPGNECKLQYKERNIFFRTHEKLKHNRASSVSVLGSKICWICWNGWCPPTDKTG